ncbi:MAG: peptidase M1 [Jatrophihabitans sp.]
MRISGRAPLVAAAVAVAMIVTGCSTTTNGHGRGSIGSVPGSSSASSTPTSPSNPPSTSQGAASCPSSYIAPDPHRPKITLAFDVSTDHGTVKGTEHVQFTPDLDITELVFRLTANTAPTVREGNKVEVTSAKADHGGKAATYTQDGAADGTQGGLLHIPFSGTISAGTTVTADVAFTLTLGHQGFDRFGRAGDFAWFASAQPLLAWQVGVGWHTEPMIQFTAESATSEAAQTDLTVTAPSADVVVASGDPRGQDAGSDRKKWHSTIDAARDVSVAVGPFQVKDQTVEGVKVRAGAPDSGGASDVMNKIGRAITELSKRFGPFPFPTLSVALLPSGGGGIEYPSSIFLLGSSTLVDVHETAHQWFYAMVGDSQATHAWLDEAFASYGEQLVNNDPPPPAALNLPGNVDRPTADYGNDEQGYYSITYDKGAAALHAARSAAGAGKFDAAIRCYVNANAWRIAVPDDLAKALKDLPAAIEVLKKAGALS